jgi:DHA1 family multidrug resistance protein-like MFS transporter
MNITLSPKTLLSRSATQGLTVLLANSTLMIFGYFIFIAVFALHFTNDLRFTVAVVGLALTLRQLAQQGLDIFGGVFADRFGFRFAITLGCMIRAVGFIGMGLAHNVTQMIAAALVMGFGGMFFDAAGTAALAAVVAPERRARTFALQATLNNVAAALGPLVGVLLYKQWGFRAVADASALVFVWIGLETALWLPPTVGRGMPEARQGLPSPSLPQVLRAIMLRRAYVRVVLLLIGFWVIIGQLTITVPLAGAALGGKNGVALLLGLNAFLAIPLQYPLVRYAERFLTATQILAGSMALTGMGLIVVFLAPNFGWQIIGIAITTVGSLAISPITNAITAQIAPQRAIGAFFGFSALAVGLGGLGQVIGGSIFDLQRHLHLPWLMALFLGVVTVGITVALARSPSPTTTPAYIPALEQPDIAADSGIIPSPAR